jgi:hypothetical protein
LLRNRKLLFVLMAILASPLVLFGQKTQLPPAAPVPPQIAASKKIFIANGGGESFETVFDQVVFNGGPDRPYNQFYEKMKALGQHELVSSPSEADLVLEISWVLSDTGLGRLPILGQLRLAIVDSRTRIVLWTLNEYVRGAMLLGNRDKNFDQAMKIIVDRLKTLMAPSPATANSK